MSGVFKLLFYTPKKGEPQFKPICYVALGDHGIRDGNPLLTPQLVEPEIDSQIDYLINELEKIRKEAKRKYKKEHERRSKKYIK